MTAAEPGLVLAGDPLDPAERFFVSLPGALVLTGCQGAAPLRPSIAELRPLVFCATWGVTFIQRSSLTKSSAS
jgi:hypothetical protein